MEDVCNITRLASLELTTGHGYRSLPVTTSYTSIVVAAFPLPDPVLVRFCVFGKP